MLRQAMYTTIETLWKQGHNKSFISKSTGHDWKTVNKVIKNLEAGKPIPTKKPHPRKLDAYKEQIIELVSQGLSAVRIHEKLISIGAKVGYSTVKAEVKLLRYSHNIFVRIHTKPGEEAQVDFGYVGKTPDDNGKFRKTWVFNMRLSYSRVDYYEEVYDQKVETFINCHVNAFRAFGGVPEIVKIDNLKAAILEANFYEPIYQKLYQEFAVYYGFKSLPCRVYRPNDKGKVESGIKYVKNNFFAGRKFKNRSELRSRLHRWQDKANNRVHGTTKKIPAQVFEAEEKRKLMDLPNTDFNLGKVGQRKVYHDCHIYVEYNYYSVPFKYVGQEVEVNIDDKLVRIYYDNQLIATHPKIAGRGEFSTTKSHYPKYKCLSETEYQERYQIKMSAVGSYAEQVFFKLLADKQGQWIRVVQGILSLVKTYSSNVVNLACQRALVFDACEYRRIKNICKSGSYLLPLDTDMFIQEIEGAYNASN